MSETTLQLLLALAFMVIALFVLPGILFIRLVELIVKNGFKALQRYLAGQHQQTRSLIEQVNNHSSSPPANSPITPESQSATSTDGIEIPK
jgi:predicted deacetylase